MASPLDMLWPPNVVEKLAKDIASGGAAGEAARKAVQKAIDAEVEKRVAARLAAQKGGGAATSVPGWALALGLFLLLD